MAYYKRLRELREDMDLTQKQVADLLFMHTTQYRRYETGERTLPLDTAISLAKLYGVSIDYIGELIDYNDLIKETNLTQEEKQLITHYRKLDKIDKVRLNERAITLSEKQSKTPMP
ncbi:MAG: helix-turn-helix transcriptional regulator [Acutalibacteraceae bacterium]|nr:helix-turn-helix transcriptional regulator [Acutalibacteraceae bacterium]